MARKQGKTIYLGANASALETALTEVEGKARAADREIKTLNRALKLIPDNVDLIQEKQKSLATATEHARKKIELLKFAQEEVEKAYEKGDIDRGQYLEFKTAVAKAEKSLQKLKDESEKTEKQLNKLANESENTESEIGELERTENDTAIVMRTTTGKIEESAKSTDELGTETKKTANQISNLSSKTETNTKKMSLFSSEIKLAKGAVSTLNTAVKTSAKVLVGLGTGLAGIGVASSNVGMNFEEGMSKVMAISGATEGQFSELRDKAKEMGSTTKFSATQASEAMSYMAMAGWSATEMVGGIDGVLNLAAASGEDLAKTSDIVTDALTAFGMEAKDSAHFADVLSSISANANTNVSMLGESFAESASLAGTLGYSVEDVSAMLGLMANSGVKGGSAGTYLKTALTRLATPTKNMKSLMEEYGISLTDSQGNMLKLRDVIGNMRTAFKDLSKEEQTQAANTLFGKQAMVGMLPILNATEEDFKKLTNAVDNADGSAQKMSETMLDNLAGSVTIFKSAAEGVGISIYDEIQEPLKNVVNNATDYLNQINDAISKHGLGGGVAIVGDILSDIAIKIVENTPQMVDAGIQFLESFGKGLIKNAPKLYASTKKVVSTLISKATSLLPTEFSAPIKKGIDIIKKSFNDGGLKKSIEKLSTFFGNLAKTGIELGSKTIPIIAKSIDFLADNIDVILPLATGLYAAFKSYAIVNSISTMVTGLATAIGVETGAVNLATIAQRLWNMEMSMNPLGIVIATATTLVGVLGSLVLAHKETTPQVDLLNESASKIGDNFTKAFESMSTFRDGVKEAKGILDDFDPSTIISDDKQEALNTQVKATQDEIKSICQSASDERRNLTEDEITALDELFKKQKEHAQKQLGIKKEYQNVIYDMSKALTANKDLDLSEYQIQSQKYLKSAQDSRDEVINLAEQQYTETLALKRQEMQASDKLDEQWYADEAKKAQADYDKAVENARKKYADTSAVIADGYNSRATELRKYEKQQSEADWNVEKENAKHNTNLKNLQEKFNREIFDAKTKYGNDTTLFNQAYTEAEQNRDAEIEKENDRHRNALTGSYEELSKTMSDEAMEQLGVWMSMLTDTEMYGGKIAESDKAFVNNAIDQLERLPNESKKAMKDTVQGMVDGLDENEHLLFEKTSKMVGGFVGLIRKLLDEHSPSRVMRKIFYLAGAGGVLGIEDSQSEMNKAGKKFAETAVNSVSDNIADFNSRVSLDDISVNHNLPNLKNINIPSTAVSGTTNNNKFEIAVNVSVDGSSNNDISSLADKIESEITHRIERRMRSYSV